MEIERRGEKEKMILIVIGSEEARCRERSKEVGETVVRDYELKLCDTKG